MARLLTLHRLFSVDENGKLVARVHQHSESSGNPGEKPHEHTTTELEIPSEGVHRTVVHDSSNEGQKEVGKVCVLKYLFIQHNFS